MSSFQNNFRKEALDYQSGLRAHSVIIKRPFSSKPSLFIFLSLFLAFLLALLLFPHSKKVKVVGVVSPDIGLSRVYSDSLGVIQEVTVNLGAEVKKGDPLLVIKPESVEALNVLDLAARLNELDEKHNALISQIENEKKRYSKLREMKSLEIQENQQYLKHLEKSKYNNQIKLDLIRKRYDLLSDENNNGAISKITQEQKYIEYLDAKEINIVLSEKISTSEITREKLENEYAKLGIEEEASILNTTILIHDIKLIIADLRRKNSYQVLSPVDGQVIGIESGAGVRVEPTTPIVTIMPDGSNLTTKLYIPSGAIGFIKEGDSFDIEYAAYPAKDYGYFKGKIETIGKSIYKVSEIRSYIDLPPGDYFICEGTLGLVAGRGESFQIKLIPGMSLSATLEGDRKNIFMWLFRPVYQRFQSI
ncbi:HlyD family secretion protein [Cellvibrio sp. NN19]|uniref:HlyD family secretion protein n=1 Tax=Cellvibrio chitinivorans TaxID=3102792 RepID=UPI002B4008F0|nr:HlyD family efflux transporter periplasmic adaptor subunit [Cellvibrio sp. NN19]